MPTPITSVTLLFHKHPGSQSILCARRWADSGPWGQMGNETALPSRRLLGKRKGAAVGPGLELGRRGHGQEEERAWAKAREKESGVYRVQGVGRGEMGEGQFPEASQATL